MSDTMRSRSIASLQVLSGKNLRLAHFQGRRLELLDIGVSLKKLVTGSERIVEGQPWVRGNCGIPVARENTTHVCDCEGGGRESGSQRERERKGALYRGRKAIVKPLESY